MGLHFTKKEFTKRKEKVLTKMIEQNIDALLKKFIYLPGFPEIYE